MNNNKSTKRALLSSVLSLVLCMAMLIGTTFAWFTDSVTSSGNIIKSGTLDVTMEWADGKNDPTNTTWMDASTGPIFKSELWEPGYTEVRHIKIANKGTLALNYQLNILANGEVSELADVIDVYYLDPAAQLADRADIPAEKKLGTLTEVLANIRTTASGNLPAGENHTITLALKMQESAGNKYQNLAIGTDFSVQLLATQKDFESDSFGKEYDADLESMQNGVLRTLEDGSTAFYYNEESGFGGRVRLTEFPENLGDEYVVPTEINDLGGALGGVTLDKLTITENVKYAYKSLEGATIGEVVVEDGATTIPNRMFYKANVESVVIPSSVTTIEQNAFAQTEGVEELVIPASVTTVEEAAFQHMTSLTTVTFEGNTAIQGYAFRGCRNLRTVYLKGDDTTFIASTLNGRNSCWFCNGESNNPNTSNITFYVENETVAARVKIAMGAEAGNTPVYIDEDVFVSVKNVTELQTALNNAIQDTIINFTADITGNATVTQKENVDIVIDGNEKKFTGVMTTFGNGRQNGVETLTIKNINFIAANGAKSCIVSPDREAQTPAKYSYSHNVTVENCTFTDVDGTVNCAAIRHEDGGDKNWVVRGCTVDNTIHSLLQVNNVAGKLTVDGCTVNSKNGINLNSCTNVEIIGYTADVKGYAVRFGVDTGGNLNEAKNFVIKNSTLKSANDDGDAIIIFRADAVKAVLTLENTTLVGTPEISGTTADTTINR